MLNKKQKKIYDFLIANPGYLKKGLDSIATRLRISNETDIRKALTTARENYLKPVAKLGTLKIVKGDSRLVYLPKNKFNPIFYSCNIWSRSNQHPVRLQQSFKFV